MPGHYLYLNSDDDTHWWQFFPILGIVLRAEYEGGIPVESVFDFNFVQRGDPNSERLQPCLVVYCHDWASQSRYRTPETGKCYLKLWFIFPTCLYVRLNVLENQDLAQDFLRQEPARHAKVYGQQYYTPLFKRDILQLLPENRTLQRWRRSTVSIL